MASNPSSALNHTWRGALGRHIYYGTQAPNWTAQDEQKFLVYAARYKWKTTLSVGDAGTKQLQKELLMYTMHSGLNTSIMAIMVQAIITKLNQVASDQVRNLFEWPEWTKRWFLNPWWDGDTCEPGAANNNTNIFRPTVDCYPGHEDVGRHSIDVLSTWDAMSDDEKDMCFAAARDAAHRSNNNTGVLSPFPIRRMTFSPPELG
ncbi:hypothetical protein IWX46DRAFT_644604 [Phyllosticta citricarpa]|uniref:Uncharacterized protein n=1 Tax=Phyllosticta citricarpa TaxID=55181 RepID=A0ABR1LC11_9PEZI